jgi:hypothetical protein
MTRRELIRLGGAAGATFLFARRTMNAEVTLVPARAAVDHLLLGSSDLDRGIAWVEEKTGVRAATGGSHPGRGTRNALLSLGGRQYLEIIAPDPAQPPSVQRADLLALGEPRLIGWAAATTDVEGLATKGRDSGERGLRFMGPRDGSRARPDGKTLKWKTLGVVTELGAGGLDPMPFFIEWSADSLHPSQDSPKGCELLSFDIEHPNPAAVARTLRQLGIDATVRQAPGAAFVATINTPRGKVELR